MAVTHSWMLSKQSIPTLSSVISLQAEPGAEKTRDFWLHRSTSKLTTSRFHWTPTVFWYLPVQGGLTWLSRKSMRQTFYIVSITDPQTFCKTVILPSNNSSKSSTKNSRNGGRLGRFSVLTSCWIFADTLLLTGTPAGQGSMETSVDSQSAPARHQEG